MGHKRGAACRAALLFTLNRSEPPRPVHRRNETRGGQREFVYSIKNTDRDKVATHQVVQHCEDITEKCLDEFVLTFAGDSII